MKLLKSSPYHRSCRAALTAILLSSVYSIGLVSASASSQTGGSTSTSSTSATVNPTKNAFLPNHHRDHANADHISSSNRPPRRRLDLDDYEEYPSSTPKSTSTSSSNRENSFARTSSHSHSHSHASTAASAANSPCHDNNRIGVPPVRIGGMLIQDDDVVSRQQRQQRRPSLSNHSNNHHNHNNNRKKTSSSHHALSNLQGGSMTTTRSFDSESQHKQQRERERSPPSTNATPNANTNTNRLLQVSLSLVLSTTSLRNSSTPLATYLDTGAQVTVMTFAAVQKAGMAHLIDTRYAGHACGVGGVCVKVLGRIPAQTVSFWVEAKDVNHHQEVEGGPGVSLKKRRIDTSPAITVLENQMEDGVELLLGLDVLEEWQALICLRDRTLTVRNCNGSIHGGRTSRSSAKDLVIPFVRPSNDGSVRTVRRTRRKDTTSTSSLDHRSGGGGGMTLSQPNHRSSKDHVSSSGLSRPSLSSASSSSLTNHNHNHNHKNTNKPKRPIANFHSLDDTATSDYSDLESDLDILDKTSNHIEWDDPSTPPSYWDEIKSRNDWSDNDDNDTNIISDHDDDYDLLHGYDDYGEEDEDDIFSSESDQDDLAGCDLSGI